MALDHVLSFQLYSARNAPPMADRLAELAELGYTNVEPYGGLYDDLDGFAGALEATGLSAASGHFGLGMLENDLDGAVRIAKRLGMWLVVCPYLDAADRPVDAAGWIAFGKRLAAVARALAPHGLTFAWHNHDFEFAPLADGSLPIRHILADPAVKLELDAAWVARAGLDPLLWIAEFAGRLVAVHVKDMAPAGENLEQDGWTDVGAGVLPWAALWAASLAAGARLMVIEHDNPPDAGRFAAASARAVRAIA